jgi:hypothetical protein
MILMNSITKNNHSSENMSNYLSHGIFVCEWENNRGLPYTQDILEQHLASIPLTSSDCCISDLTPLKELNTKENEIFIASIKLYLDKLNFKRISLVGYKSENKTHQEIYKVLNISGVDVKMFPTICHAKQWLLLPEIDEDVWSNVSVLTF